MTCIKMIKKTKQLTLALGCSIKYAPRTPAIAPLAPTIGMFESGLTKA